MSGSRSERDPREPRDLDNEIPSDAVDVLLSAVERHHHLAHRWFRHKANLLGLEKLSLGDGVERQGMESALGKLGERLRRTRDRRKVHHGRQTPASLRQTPPR